MRPHSEKNIKKENEEKFNVLLLQTKLVYSKKFILNIEEVKDYKL
jgi:hypothetical protein